MLVKGTSLSDSVDVAFPFLVEILTRVQQKLSNIYIISYIHQKLSQHKLMRIVEQYFYHPALEKVATCIDHEALYII